MKIKLFIIILLAIPLISANLGFINSNLPKLQSNQFNSCTCSSNSSSSNSSTDISGLVPYTGATSDVDLGSQTLTTSQQLIANVFQDYSTSVFFGYDGTNWLFQNPINVNGLIKQQNINVCLSNGTNCLPSTGSSDGTGGWTNTSINTSTNLDVYINASIHADSYQRSNPINKSPLFETTFDDMNQNVGAYNRITTAPTLGTADNDVPSNINFPTANTYVSDGGLVLTGNVATNTATINVSHLKYYSIRARFTTGHKRTDMIGLFKTATSVNMVTAFTGVFFYANNSNYSALENNSIRNWTAMLCNAGTCSKLNSTVGNQTGWHIFTIVSNNREAYAPSNNFTFYIDGVNLGTLQTNMPTTRVATLGTWTESTDTTIDTLVVDWAYYEMYRI